MDFKKLHEIKESKGIKTKWLCEKTGVSTYAYYSHLRGESKEMGVGRFMALCKALELSPEQINEISGG